MFLNVVTTNSTEVSELLGNLSAAIANVVILYVPTIIYAIFIIFKGKKLTINAIRKYRRCSLFIIVPGSISLLCSYITDKNYSLSKDLFPINVSENVIRAINRTIKTNNYPNTSREFAYQASSSRQKDKKEIYVLVIGETSRATNWQLSGYSRPTNPELSKLNDVIYFSKVLTESNTTHKSVPMLLSSITAENFDSIYYHKSIITAFKEAGFHSSFYSNQMRNRSFIDYFAHEADKIEFLNDNCKHNFDEVLIEKIDKTLTENNSKKHFIVLHTYGSHFNYKERYPENMSKFKPDNATDASPSFRSGLINAYDNSIAYTDYILSSIIRTLKNYNDSDIAMLYVSDHGEDIFDDSRNRFLHASPIPTYYQLHVPMIIWMSETFCKNHPQIKNATILNKDKNISSSSSTFHTLLQLAGIKTDQLVHKASLADITYTEPIRLYLSDRNEALPINISGIKSTDHNLLKQAKIITD